MVKDLGCRYLLAGQSVLTLGSPFEKGNEHSSYVEVPKHHKKSNHCFEPLIGTSADGGLHGCQMLDQGSEGVDVRAEARPAFLYESDTGDKKPPTTSNSSATDPDPSLTKSFAISNIPMSRSAFTNRESILFDPHVSGASGDFRVSTFRQAETLSMGQVNWANET